MDLTVDFSNYRSYVAVPIFFFLWAGYKLFRKTRVIAPHNVDLVTGLRQIEEEEQKYLADEAAKGPQTRLGKLWDSL